MKPNLLTAVLSLVPGAQVTIQGNTDVTWHVPSEAPVTETEIQAEFLRLQAEYDSAEYQRLRANEYPPIGDQLDALFHAGVFPDEMATKLQAVKDKYPKN